MKLRIALLFPFALVALAHAACSTTASAGATAPCGGGCSSAQFCCVDTCLPFGSTCGATDGGLGVDDGGGAGDASVDPCSLHAGAARIDRACASRGVIDCGPRTTASCNPGYVCTEWIDPGGTLEADCVDPSEAAVCDPARDTSRCEGTIAKTCQPSAQAPSPNQVHPPGWWLAQDCPKTWAPDATCAVDATGHPYCASPSDVACDPDTFEETCQSRCQPGGPAKGVVRPKTCPADQQCVKNAFTGRFTACVPASAVPSASPLPGGAGYLRCESDTVIRVEQAGYEWDATCGKETGDLSGLSTRCYDPPGPAPAECIDPSYELCDPAVAQASCVDASHRRYCTGGYYFDVASCLTNEHCDATTSACVPN